MIHLQIVIASLALIYLVYTVQVGRKLSAFPGPFLTRYTNWWKVYHVYKGDYTQILRDWHEHHGSLIRIGPNSLSVAEPREVSKIHGISPIFHKGRMYKPLIGWFKGRNVAGLESLMDSKEHTTLKRIISPAFSTTAVAQYESRIDCCADELVGHIARLGTFDITKWMKWYSIDSINMVAFSSTPGFMKNAQDIDKTLETVQSMLTMMIFTYPVATAFMWIAWATSFIGHYIIPTVPFVKLGVQHVNARLADPKKSQVDILGTYMMARQMQPTVFTDEKLVGMTLSIVIAGSDTTALILIWTLYALMRDEVVTAKLQVEIENAMQQGTLSYPPSLKELSSLPYLNATMKEGLRYTMMLQVGLERTVPPDMEVCNRPIPEVTALGCHQAIIHMDRGVFGEDATTFNPSRWIDCSEERQRLMDRCGLWFGQGKHLCIGQHIARAEMLKALAMMFMKLDLSPSDKDATMVSKCVNMFRFPTVPYYVSVKKKDMVPQSDSSG